MLLAMTHLPSPKLQECELTFVQSEPISLEKATLQHTAYGCLLYTSPSPRDRQKSRMPSSA